MNASERDFFEPRFGRSLSQVRLHEGPQADAAARAVAARAYTLGNDIVLRSGAYVTGKGGRRRLAHELTHVLQQSAQRATGVIQRQAEGCSITATREPRGSGFCIEGEADVPDGTTVSFHYIPGMTSCTKSDLEIMPPFGSTKVSGGEFSWTAPTNLGSPIPGVGRFMGAIVGGMACCTRVIPGSC